ncbi:MAG: 2-C-methyl-D-erythritol 4-phosphate cytidylyltransferase, partial [Fidelibacterota bacterium]
MAPDLVKVAAVIPAAGLSTRLTGDTKKQFRLLGEEPLLIHTLRRVMAADEIKIMAVAVPTGELTYVRELLQPIIPKDINIIVVAGGDSRQASVSAGLAALPDNIDIIMVHDAVRPLLEPRWITATIALCRDYDGAIVAIPATDTLKDIPPPAGGAAGQSRVISRTIPRESIWRAQTPQTFRADVLRRALAHAEQNGLTGTDEAELVEAIGGKIAVVEGSPHNIKVTTPEDWHYL